MWSEVAKAVLKKAPAVKRSEKQRQEDAQRAFKRRNERAMVAANRRRMQHGPKKRENEKKQNLQRRQRLGGSVPWLLFKRDALRPQQQPLPAQVQILLMLLVLLQQRHC